MIKKLFKWIGMLLDIILAIPILILMTLLLGFVNIVMWLAKNLEIGGINNDKN